MASKSYSPDISEDLHPNCESEQLLLMLTMLLTELMGNYKEPATFFHSCIQEFSLAKLTKVISPINWGEYTLANLAN